MARKKLLLLLKPLDVYPIRQLEAPSHINNPRMLRYLENRHKVQKNAINLCKNVLRNKPIEWEPLFRNSLAEPIHGVDLVVTVGGDGTLLHASHFMDDTIPVLGVNSDPTQIEEVEEFSNEFDANRSTGYLCAATVNNFEQILDSIIEGRIVPSQLSRLSICVNSQRLSTYALNDVLIAHPCPAAVSRFSFITKRNDQSPSPIVHCRSSGLRVSTATGSTAAMLSAGGFPMSISSNDLQYMVREPISPGADSSLMHGLIKFDHSMDFTWCSEEGIIFVDGCHVCYSINGGDMVQVYSKAPVLKLFAPHHMLTQKIDAKI